jgi:hypothetical protein
VFNSDSLFSAAWFAAHDKVVVAHFFIVLFTDKPVALIFIILVDFVLANPNACFATLFDLLLGVSTSFYDLEPLVFTQLFFVGNVSTFALA